MWNRRPSWSSMSESRFSSRGVGAAGATSTAGFLRTVNLSDAAAIFLASIALVGAQRNDALLLTDLSGGGGERSGTWVRLYARSYR